MNGLIYLELKPLFVESTLDNKALLSNPSQAPLASLQEKRSVFSDTKCEHKTCPEGDGIWNEDVTMIDLEENGPRIGNLLTTFGKGSLMSKGLLNFFLYSKIFTKSLSLKISK